MNDLLVFAHTLADAAGAAIRPYFGVAVDVETKSDNSPVSIADRAAEAAIRALIAQHYPEHGIYGEEFGTSAGSSRVASHGEPRAAGVSAQRVGGKEPPSSKYTWVIDPIDGTRAFLAGGKEWGTLIGLCEAGIPILGILDQPITGERWAAVRGEHSLKTRACASLAAAKISTTSARYFTAPQAVRFAALAEQCKTVIADGDCYAYGLLARGERDLVVDAGLKPYDILALVPIIEAASGVITGWDGAPITLTHYNTALAAGDATRHKEALDILQKSL